MGLFHTLKVNEGVCLVSGANLVELILRWKGGSVKCREAVFEVRGVLGLNHLYMTSVDGLRPITADFKIGIRQLDKPHSGVELHFKPDKEAYLGFRKYE